MQERAVVQERRHNLFYGLLISVLPFLLSGGRGGYSLFVTTNPQQVFVESVTFEMLDKNYLFSELHSNFIFAFWVQKRMATLQAKNFCNFHLWGEKIFRLDRMLPGRSECKPIYLSS